MKSRRPSILNYSATMVFTANMSFTSLIYADCMRFITGKSVQYLSFEVIRRLVNLYDEGKDVHAVVNVPNGGLRLSSVRCGAIEIRHGYVCSKLW